MKKFLMILLTVILIIILLVFIFNFIVVFSTYKKILSRENLDKEVKYDVIFVLGCGIIGNSPTDMLRDRLNEAYELYSEGFAKKIIVSGDHGKVDYDEVNLMKSYLIEKGVLSEDIFMDHAGFSTYESMYRAKEIFGIDSMIIVTQKYHLYRAIYISNKLGINNNIGVNSDPRKYMFQFKREIREIFARDKDLIKCIYKPNPTYLGDKIDINGSGDITNDKD